jgi:hypothetical protein
MPPHSGNCDDILESWFINAKRDLLCSPTVVPRLSSRHSVLQCNQFPGSIDHCVPLDTTILSLKKKESRHVCFASSDQIFEIPRTSDLSADEFKAVYMSREEMGRIHEECWRLVDLMNNGIEYEDQEGFSKRGLVDLKDESVERRRKVRDQAYRIVFGVQKFNAGNRRSTDCMDVTEVTASLYSKAATRAQEDAWEAAWFDAIAARL